MSLWLEYLRRKSLGERIIASCEQHPAAKVNREAASKSLHVAMGLLSRRLRRIYCALSAIIMATVLISCGRHLAAPDDSAVEEVFRPFQVAAGGADATRDLDVFVDGSLSMRGYVTTEGSNYSRVIRELLQSGTAATFNLNTYKFTTTINSV